MLVYDTSSGNATGSFDGGVGARTSPFAPELNRYVAFPHRETQQAEVRIFTTQD
jgi:hypothetical protein